MLAKLLRSSSLRAAIGFGAGGVAYGLANLILARELAPVEFGVLALCLALSQLGLSFGPCGLETFAARQRPRVGRQFIGLLMMTSSGVAVVLAAVAGFFYFLSLPLVILTLVASAAAAVNSVGAALFQGEQQMKTAMGLSQIHNYVLLVVACAAFALPVDARIAFGVAALGYVATSLWGWARARRTLNVGRVDIAPRVALMEGLSVLGIGVALQLLMQFERLAIPKLGSLEMLSQLAVLATVVGSPFRMLQIGTSFTLLPRLRNATSRAAALRVLRLEIAAAAALVAAACIAIVLAAPLIFGTVLGGKYDITGSLLAASLIVGAVKLADGFSTTVVLACGTQQHLRTLSFYSLGCLALAVFATWFGSRYGLLGIIYGVGVAWLALTIIASIMARRCLRLRFAQPVAS